MTPTGAARAIVWDRLRPALAPAPPSAAAAPAPVPAPVPAPALAATPLEGSSVDGAATAASPEAQHHQGRPGLDKGFPAAPRTHRNPFANTTVSASDTISLLQPLYRKTAARVSALATRTDNDDARTDFDLLTGLGIDQSPTTRRYEIRRGVAHRVDQGQQ